MFQEIQIYRKQRARQRPRIGSLLLPFLMTAMAVVSPSKRSEPMRERWGARCFR